MATHLTDDEKAQIIRFARNGAAGVRGIAKLVGRSDSGVRRFLKRAGVSTRPDGKRWSSYDDADLQYFLRADFPRRAIAKQMQRPISTLNARLLDQGYTPRQKNYEAHRVAWSRKIVMRLRPSTYEAARDVGIECDMHPSEVLRCVLRAVQRRDLWRELLTPVHEILLRGDKKPE